MVKLEILFEEYGGGNLCKYNVQRDDLLEALRVICEELELYNISEEIEDGIIDVDDTLNLMYESCDGGPYIFLLKDLISGDTYIDNIQEKEL